MAVNNIVIGPNSHRIQYDAGTVIADLIAGVESAVLATHGWELYDATAGTNAKCYRALNKDGVTYKYTVLDYNTSGKLIAKVYESWNSGTHVGTNLAYNSDAGSAAQLVNLVNGGNLYLFINPRWLVLSSYVLGAIGTGTANYLGPSGIVEFERIHPEDTGAAGYPCFQSLYSNGVSAPGYIPRTRGGLVSSANTLWGMGNPWGSALSYGLSPWSNLYQACDSWAYASSYSQAGVGSDVRGRHFGLKLFPNNAGQYMDETTVNVNAEFFVDPNGTPTGFWVLVHGTSTNRILLPK